jgi:hypothetical protein
MGYSIMAPFKNEQDKNKMERFLSLHYKPLDEIVKILIEEPEEKNLPTSELSYKPDEDIQVIGFDYNSSGIKRTHYFVMCYWMATMAGKRKLFEGTLRPFVIYDGEEEMVLFINEKANKDFDYVEVNEIGFRANPELKEQKGIFDFLGKKYFKKVRLIDSLVEKELLRLTDEWNTFEI